MVKLFGWPLGEVDAGMRDADWLRIAREVPLVSRYAGAARERLRALADRFLAAKHICGAGGLELDARLRSLIAVQACVPILNLGIEWYRGWVSVIVYPRAFVARHAHVDDDGVVHETAEVLSGEAWEAGPVVLSLEDVLAGASAREEGNVVIHEFAHKLDALNGVVNGMPPLHADMDRRAWTEDFTRGFDEVAERWAAGRTDYLGSLGADDPGEFFAVASELFFVEPETLRREHPRVFAHLRDFYRQDPAPLLR